MTPKVTTLTISKKRLEDSLDTTIYPSRYEPHNAIPVNHNEARGNSRCGRLAQTTNTSCYLWGGGLVVLYRKGRGLNIEYNNIRSYSTKSQYNAPSWNDTKVALRLKTLWEGNSNDPQFDNQGL